VGLCPFPLSWELFERAESEVKLNELCLLGWGYKYVDLGEIFSSARLDSLHSDKEFDGDWNWSLSFFVYPPLTLGATSGLSSGGE
jgi:hypothetical protein